MCVSGGWLGITVRRDELFILPFPFGNHRRHHHRHRRRSFTTLMQAAGDADDADDTAARRLRYKRETVGL